MAYHDHCFRLDVVVGIVGDVGFFYRIAGRCGSCFDSGVCCSDAWGGVVLYVKNLVDRKGLVMKLVGGLTLIGLIGLSACVSKPDTTLLTLDLKGDRCFKYG